MRRTRETESKGAREAINEAARERRQRMTKSERLLWNALRDRRFEGLKFRRQSRVGHFVVDFYCAEHALVIEVDGGIHLTQKEQDRERQELIEDMGFRVLRLDAEMVECGLQDALEMIRRACLASGRLPLRGREVAAGRGEGVEAT